MAATSNPKVETIPKCYHCGELCEDELVVYDQKEFCCQGCKMVYEILESNGLCNYYDLQNSPGINLKNKNFDQKFAYLDNQEIQNQLLRFSSETLQKIVFHVPAIHCSSCIWLLEHLDRLREGIVHSRVNFVRKEVAIDFNHNIISLKTIVELLATVGYEPEINLKNASKTNAKKQNRNLYLQVGIAGFGFGNIMLLSFPEYFGFEGLNHTVRLFMTYLNILIALPVVFYSASGYFISAYKGLQQKYINIDVPIVIGIITLFVRSLYEILAETGPGYLDSLSGLIFFLLIGKWFQSRTYESLSFERDYTSYFPLAVTKLTGKLRETVQITQLKENDIIEVRNQEIIPGDAELLSDTANIDYSFVTGEAETVVKTKGDYIYAGGRQVGSSIRLQVKKEVSQSYLTQLWNNDAFSETNAYDTLIDKISKYFTLAVLGIAFVTAIYWYFNGPSHILNAFTAVLIVACPCALSLATPFTLGTAMTILGRHKFYLKHLSVIEKLWEIDTIVFDKTGTLTKSNQSAITYTGKALSPAQESLVASVVGHSTHPLSRAIKNYFKSITDLINLSFFEEIDGKGIRASTPDGDVVIIGTASFTGSTYNNLQNRGSQVHVSFNGVHWGFFKVETTYRKGLHHMVRDLLEKFKLAVLSGDNDSEKKKLEQLLGTTAQYVFNQKPEEKLRYVANLQKEQNNVLMLGDGLNDAGALKQANVGIAVTEDVTAFTPACDAILYGNQLTNLGTYLLFSKKSKQIILVSFAISFLYNFIGLALAVSAQISPLYAAILMPLSSISVVAFATFAIRYLAWKNNLL